MKGLWIVYSAAEMAWLDANRLMVISDYHQAFNAAFGREVSLANLHALRKRKGWRTGRTGCFEKQNVPYNKGVPRPFNANCAATQFKPGHGRSGIAVKLYRPIGTERLCKDGYLERKIHDGMPLQSRWRAVHLIRWEAINGPIPKGFALKALDSNRLNTEPANWTLIPRAMLPRLNGGRHKRAMPYDSAAPELKPTILAVAKLDHAARTARKRAAA